MVISKTPCVCVLPRQFRPRGRMDSLAGGLLKRGVAARARSRGGGWRFRRKIVHIRRCPQGVFGPPVDKKHQVTRQSPPPHAITGITNARNYTRRTHSHTHSPHVPTLRVSRRRLGVVARALPSAPCPVAAATRGAALPRTAPPCRSRRSHQHPHTRRFVASSPHRGRDSRKSGVQHFRQVFMVRQG